MFHIQLRCASRMRAISLAMVCLAGLAACNDTDRREGWFSGLASRAQNDTGGGFGGGSQTAIPGRSADDLRPYIVPGTDQFINPALGLPNGAARDQDGILLNFEDADLKQVIETVLGEVLGVNYFFDPRVQGRVTLQTVSALNDQDTLGAVQLVLRQNGAALVVRDNIYAILPAAEAGAGALVPVLSNGAVSLNPGMAVLVAPLKSASASELAGVIEPLAGTQTTVRYDAARNVLILAGPASDVASLRETIAMFDVEWMDGLSYGLFPLRNAQATDVIPELQAILGGPDSPIRDQVVLEPVTRMNAVLIVTKRNSVMQELRGWVGRLDRDLGAGQDGVYVYRVENIPASDLAEALTQVFGGSGGAGLGGGASFAPNETLASASTDGAVPAASTGAQLAIGGDDVRVFANEVNNTLVVRSSPETYQRIVAVIRQLDVAPMQVLIEATIAEVQLNNQLNYGVQTYLQNSRRTLVNSSGNSANIGGSYPGFVASYVTGGAEVVLSALDSVTQLNVISNPRLMVLDNQSARLNVGDEVPIITQQQQGSSGDSNIVNQVQFRQTGIVLEVSPRISSSGLVTLEIRQETSNVVEDASTGSLTPTISQRTIESSIAVQNGQTILLGGLIEGTDSAGKTGIPILSDAPIVGGLFGTRRNRSDRNELIVMLTPRIVRNPNEVRHITEELRQRVQSMSPEFAPRNTLTQLNRN